MLNISKVSCLALVLLSVNLISALRIFNFKSVQCSSSNKTLDRLSCVLNRYSKSNSSLSMSMNFTRSSYNLTVRNIELLKNYYKTVCFQQMHFEMSYSSPPYPYRSLIKIENAQVCELLNGTRNNPAIKWIFELAKETIPNEDLHSCPYFVITFIFHFCLKFIEFLL